MGRCISCNELIPDNMCLCNNCGRIQSKMENNALIEDAVQEDMALKHSLEKD